MCAHGFKNFSNGLVLKYWINTICLLLEYYFPIIMFTETFFTIFFFVIGQKIVSALLSLAARKIPLASAAFRT
jgi:hypothetical protein